MDVTEVHDLGQLETLVGQWQVLAAATPAPSPFLTPEFLLPWLERVKHRDRSKVLICRSNGELVGLAPLLERRFRKLGVSFSLLTWPTSVPPAPFDFLVPSGRCDIYQAFLNHLTARGDWDMLRLSHVPAQSPTVAFFRDLAERDTRCSHSIVAAGSSYVLDIEGSWEDFVKRSGASFRRSIKRSRIVAERCGRASFANYPGGLPIEAARSSLRQVLSKSWKSGDSNEAENFIEMLVDRLYRSDMAFISVCYIDERPAAVSLSIHYCGIITGLLTAFDPAFRQARPGIALMEFETRLAFEKQCTLVDQCGDWDYLKHWSTRSVDFVDIELVRRNHWRQAKSHIYLMANQRRRSALLSDIERRRKVHG